jgi:anhydro-N-acetylmuramic acid kinase
MKTATKRGRLLLGLMSGTSADGIDVALVRIGAGAVTGRSRARLENFMTLPFPREIRAHLLRIAEGGATSSGELSQLNFRMGHLFANAALEACKRFRVRPSRVYLIGSHGQTIYHQGAARPYLGMRVASTMQIGEPAVIAAKTGITTVGDFRPADIAVGGQGAPLVPFVDYLLYRDAQRGRAALNIGGIANVTVIPRAAEPSDVFAFDTGPGNMVVDARRTTAARESPHAAAACPAWWTRSFRKPIFGGRHRKPPGANSTAPPSFVKCLRGDGAIARGPRT